MNSQEFSVIEPGVLLTDDETGYKYWSVLVEPKDLEENEAIALKILDKDSALAYEKNIKQMQDKLKQTSDHAAKTELTKEIDNARKAFDRIVYAYAITVHKSQGSTMERVFIDVDNIYQSNTKQKMLYTAVTRASSSIHVYSGFSQEDRIDLDDLFN